MLARWGIRLVVVGACALRAVLAWRDDGVLYPDEVFQSVEQAHRLWFHVGFVPWEFVVGARPWVLPALLVPAVALGGWLGAKLALALASGLTAGACAWLVRSLRGGVTAQVLAAASWGLLNVAVLLGPRGLAESACTLPLVAGLALALEEPASRSKVRWGSALLALAVMVRVQVALVAVALPVVFWLRRDRRAARHAFVTLAFGAAVFGLIDWVTWGAPFHSLFEYWRFNVVEGRAAAEFGRAPFTYYAEHLFACAPAFSVLALVASLAACLWSPAARALASLWAVFFLVHCCIAHKELRFVLPAVPLWCATAALGFDALRERWPRFGRVAPVVLALALTLETPPVSLTWRQLGMAHPTPEAAAFDDGGPENRLLRVAGQRPDVCGVELLNREVDASGGYSALRRAVPLFDATHPPRDPRSVNAVIGTRGSADGVELATDGAYALVRLRDVSACAPATDFDGRFH